MSDPETINPAAEFETLLLPVLYTFIVLPPSGISAQKSPISPDAMPFTAK